jgi:hypothetical protein
MSETVTTSKTSGSDGGTLGLLCPQWQGAGTSSVHELAAEHMLDWIRNSGHKLVVVFEGRDAAGKRGRA